MNGLSRSSFIAAGAGTLALAACGRAKALDRDSKRRVRFGANYVPTKNWWYSWGDWDRDSIRRDLDDIAALGLDHIRIQLLWPQFQPNAATISAEHLARLEQLLELADATALDVQVTVLDGQLSGFLFVPPWLIDNQDGHIHNFVTDPSLLAPQRRLFDALAESIGSHPRFLGFDISNEVYWFTQPLKVNFTAQQGDRWMEALLAHCARIAPEKFHVNGVDKWPYESASPSGFTREALARAGSASVVHPWAGFGPIYPKYGPLSVEATHYAEFLLQYMQAFSNDGRRTLWIEEDGCSKQWMHEDLIPRWAEASVRNAASCDRLFGITWWCSHDVNARYTGFNKLEYDLGLYTNDRRLKPLGAKLRDLVREFDAHPPHVLPRPEAIVITSRTGSDDLLEPYMRLVKAGHRPQIVLQSNAHDAAYLKARGIERIITV
ncbi:MAG: glycoside hydrolase 5 family protein [Vulcanimicrobiaceae bacterium]